MPTFASTTTSGYGDPLKAMSIKALEARLKDQQAQAAQQQPDAAMMGTIPGGIGHVLGVVGDRMQQGRNEQAIAAQKQELARMMSGYDATGDAPPPAGIATVAPDMYKDMMQAWIGYRQAKMSDTTQRYSTDSTAATAREGHGVTRSGNQLQADVAREGHGVQREGQGNQAAIATAEIEGRAANAKTVADATVAAANADPVKEKARLDLSRALTQKQLMTAKLEAAGEAFNHPEGIMEGTSGRLLAQGSAMTGLGDKAKAQRTLLFDDAMNEVATGKMADVLTGPTTNFELQRFLKTGNNPDIDIDVRRQLFRNVLTAYKKDRDDAAASATKLGLNATDPTAPAPAAPAATAPAVADPLEGKIADGPDGPMVRRGGKWVKE